MATPTQESTQLPHGGDEKAPIYDGHDSSQRAAAVLADSKQTAPAPVAAVANGSAAGPSTTAPTTAAVATAPEPTTTAPAPVAAVAAPTTSEPVNDLKEHATGTFAGGAVTANPTATEDKGLKERAATAETALDAATISKIEKSEGKNAKQMAKLLKNEGKAQEAHLKTSIKELAKLQAVQKTAAQAESKALTRNSKATKIEQKEKVKLQKQQALFDKADAEYKAAQNALEETRAHAALKSEELKKKTLEVERATAQKATDDRERAAKLAALKGGKK